MKILSVDDDPVFLEIIKSGLVTLGYTDVVQVESGDEAIERVDREASDFDCFLLDIDMPGMDGVTLCQHLRAHPRAKDATIIMVTARAEIESVNRAFTVGATDYLNKPLDPLELRGRLQSAETVAQLRQAKNSENASGLSGADFEFSEAIRLDPTAGCIDFIAMQNFVLKLGSMQMFNRVALGIHLKNAETLFASLSRTDFRDTLSDVAEVIVDGLGTCPKVMSYAGSGDFVVLLDRVRVLDQEELANNLTTALLQLGEWYSEQGFPVPTLKLGKPASRRFLNFFAVDEVLDDAIKSAHESTLEISYVPTFVMPKITSKKRVSMWG